MSPHWPGPRRKKEFEPHDDQTKVLIRTIDELYRLPESNTVVPLLEDWKWRDKMETAAEKQRYLEPMLARVSRAPEKHRGELIFLLLVCELQGVERSTVYNSKAQALRNLNDDDCFFMALCGMRLVRDSERRAQLMEKYPDGRLKDGRRIVHIDEAA